MLTLFRETQTKFLLIVCISVSMWSSNQWMTLAEENVSNLSTNKTEANNTNISPDTKKVENITKVDNGTQLNTNSSSTEKQTRSTSSPGVEPHSEYTGYTGYPTGVLVGGIILGVVMVLVILGGCRLKRSYGHGEHITLNSDSRASYTSQ